LGPPLNFNRCIKGYISTGALVLAASGTLHQRYLFPNFNCIVICTISSVKKYSEYLQMNIEYTEYLSIRGLGLVINMVTCGKIPVPDMD